MNIKKATFEKDVSDYGALSILAITLSQNPKYSNPEIEQPISGYYCGDYVAICAYKK